MLIEPEMTVLTAVLKEVVEEIAPERDELICEREVLWLESTVLTAVLKDVIAEAFALVELLIWERDVLTLAFRLSVSEWAIDSA